MTQTTKKSENESEGRERIILITSERYISNHFAENEILWFQMMMPRSRNGRNLAQTANRACSARGDGSSSKRGAFTFNVLSIISNLLSHKRDKHSFSKAIHIIALLITHTTSDLRKHATDKQRWLDTMYVVSCQRLLFLLHATHRPSTHPTTFSIRNISFVVILKQRQWSGRK